MQTGLQTAFMISQLFNGLMPDAQIRRFEDGESLSACADAEQSVGLVIRGLADVWCLATDGTETLLNTARQGDCFGIAYVYDQGDMQTRVVARGRCEAALIRKSDIQALILRDQAFAVRYYSLCNRKLQFLLSRISLLTSQSCRTRLAAYLLLNRDQADTVPLRGNKDELASRLSVSRAAVYRELNALQEKGLIELTKRDVTLKNVEGLEQLLYTKE